MRTKLRMLQNYAKGYDCKVFVETGTFKGDAVKAMLLTKQFWELHTIEAEEYRAKRAARRFRDIPNVCCWLGDSVALLPGILSNITEPVLFWLDAHYIGTDADRGRISTPVLKELEIVLQHDGRDVILIDDARLFDQERLEGYPTKDDIRNVIHRHRPDWIINMSGDVIQARRPYADYAKTR